MYRANRIQGIPSGKGTNITRRHKINNAIENSNLNLLKIDNNKQEYEILRFDYKRMKDMTQKYGGEDVFGKFEEIDTFNLR